MWRPLAVLAGGLAVLHHQGKVHFGRTGPQMSEEWLQQGMKNHDVPRNQAQARNVQEYTAMFQGGLLATELAARAVDNAPAFARAAVPVAQHFMVR